MSDPRDDLAALTDDDNRTYIGQPPEPDDIRTWDGLQAIIEANENWGVGHIIEQMKTAGWKEPKPPTVYPPHDINVERAPYCIVCGRDVQWDDNTQSWQH